MKRKKWFPHRPAGRCIRVQMVGMRRIVTEWRDSTTSILFNDEFSAELETGLMHVADVWATDVWATDTPPPHIHSSDDAALREWRYEPDPHGSIFRILTLLPGVAVRGHTSETLDYLVVVSGTVTLTVGNEEAVVSAGDVIVQNGVPHTWVNRSDKPCVLALVRLSTKGK
jgi:quercetin dioxygenase-like cupin family protein